MCRPDGPEHGPSDLSSSPAGPIFLDAVGVCSNNGARVRPSASLLLTLVAATLAALPATAAGQTRADTTLQSKLARALAVPHVPKAGAAALAVELATGRAVFARNSSAPLAPASTE